MLAAAVLFSSGGTVIKLTSLTGWQVAALRSGVAALALLVLARSARRGWSWRTPLVGLTSAVTLILFVSSNKLTTAANAIFLQATAPLYLLLLSPLLLKERVRRSDVGFMAILASGLALIIVGQEAPSGTAPNPGLGNLLAAASGLSWALTIAGLRWLARPAPGVTGQAAADASNVAVPATVAANLLGFLICAPFAFPLGPTAVIDWAAVLFLGVFQIAVAYLCMTASIRRVPAFEGALLLLLEPVLSALITVVVHGEWPRPLGLAGCSLILVATVGHALHGARYARTGS